MVENYHSSSARLLAVCEDPSVALPTSPYFDMVAGSLPGPDRVESAAAIECVRSQVHDASTLCSVMPQAPSAPQDVEISPLEIRRWYAKYLAFEVALGSMPLRDDGALVEAVTLSCWNEVRFLESVEATETKPSQSRENLARLLLPIVVRCARHLECGVAVLPLAAISPLDIADRTDFWSRFFREESDLELPTPPPEVEFGERTLKRSREWRRPTLVVDDLGTCVRQDVSKCLEIDDKVLMDWLVSLRQRIPEVAPPQFEESRLRAWGKPKAKVLGWAIGTVLSRLGPSSGREDDALRCGHALPAALTLVDSFETDIRNNLGLDNVLRILQRFPPTSLASVEGVAFRSLSDHRSLCHEDPDAAALIGRCVLRLVNVLDSPTARRIRAEQCVDDAVHDCKTWRVEACRVEVLRWRLCPTMLLHLAQDSSHPFAIAARLRYLVPVLSAVLTSRDPGPSSLLALRSLHATAALAWPRLKKGNLLKELIAVAVAATRKAIAFAKHSKSDKPFAKYGRLVLVHLERFLALLLVLAPGDKVDDDSSAGHLLGIAVRRFPEVSPVVKAATMRARRRQNRQQQ